MIARGRTFLQVLMAVLALGLGAPQPVCATGAREPGKVCCCTGTPICACQPTKPCQQSCTLVQVQPTDKQAPTVATFAISHLFLYQIIPAKFRYPTRNRAICRWDSRAVPLFNGSPPQASLCVWRI